MTYTTARARRLDLELRNLYEQLGVGPETTFKDLTILIEEAKLERDTEALCAAQHGLRKVYARQVNESDDSTIASFCRGRVAQMIDGVNWLLQRLAAQKAAREIEPGSHAHQFLKLVAQLQPDAELRTLQSALEGASQVGTFLEQRGLVARRILGRVVTFDLTPLGCQRLTNLGTSTPDRAS